MERQVPCRIPGVLPFVGHRDDVAVQHVEPFAISNPPRAVSQQWMGLMLLQPSVDVKIVILLGPQHARDGLPMHALFILAKILRSYAFIELVCVSKSAGKDLIEIPETVPSWFRT